MKDFFYFILHLKAFYLINKDRIEVFNQFECNEVYHGRSIKKQYYQNKSISSFLSFSVFTFYTDTHYAQSPKQSNRRSRCTIHWSSITKQHCQNKSISSFLSFSFFIQTLTTLNLSLNQIGGQGAQSIGQALQNNTVRINQSLHFSHFHFSPFIQTLTTLNLRNNQIGDQGAQSIGQALQYNTVRINLSLHFFHFHFFHFSYRHSLHSTSLGIKSEIKLHNLSLKHYNTTLSE